MALIGKEPHQEQVSALLNAVGNIGAQTGYPALALQLTNDPAQLSQVDKDILPIGELPESLRDEAKVGLLAEATKSWVKMLVRQTALPDEGSPKTDGRPDSRTDIRAETAMAAIVGTQSPYFAQRSIVALLADSPQGYTLLNNALIDSTKRATVFGSGGSHPRFGRQQLTRGGYVLRGPSSVVGTHLARTGAAPALAGQYFHLGHDHFRLAVVARPESA